MQNYSTKLSWLWEYFGGFFVSSYTFFSGITLSTPVICITKLLNFFIKLNITINFLRTSFNSYTQSCSTDAASDVKKRQKIPTEYSNSHVVNKTFWRPEFKHLINIVKQTGLICIDLDLCIVNKHFLSI